MPPAGIDSLLTRYGKKPEDLAPFEAGKPLRGIIDDVLRHANARRVQANKRPVFLHWMRDEIVGPQKTAAARKKWAEGDSLLIVDSISAYVSQIANQLLALPESKQPQRASLLWVPPYTQHTATLEDALALTVAVIPRLEDLFNDWKNCPLRTMSFDTGTLAAARLWLHRAFLDVTDTDEIAPSPEAVDGIVTGAGHRVQLGPILARGLEDGP
jgi:hypothetical protein